MRLPKLKQSGFFKGEAILIWLMLSAYAVLNVSCKGRSETVEPEWEPLKPDYSCIRLVAKDTLHFHLEQDTYNKIKSFNYFISKNGTAHIAFYDRLSESVSIYDFATRKLIKKMSLEKIIKARRFYKTSVYVKNYDSMFITNLDKLYLLDSAGRIKFVNTFNSIESMAFYENPLPVIIKGNKTLMGVRPFVKEKSISAVREWRIIAAFDLEKDECDLHYSLPVVYRKGLYGRRFLEYSYCYNDRNNFVFSFPADSNIYETNLTDYHIAYSGRSKFQSGAIEPVSRKALENDEGGKEYTLRDSYGPIYFDPYMKRYLRIAKQKVSREAYAAKTGSRKTSIIVFDRHLKIIGEFICNNDFMPDTIFFTAEGSIYARINPKDESALHFVQLAWIGEPDEPMPITKK